MKAPPLVFVIALLYITVGLGGFVSHFPRHWRPEDVLIETVEVLAITCGVFLLRGENWARWLALAWMAIHVVISFPKVSQTGIHLLFLVVMAWALFRPGMQRHFGVVPISGTNS